MKPESPSSNKLLPRWLVEAQKASSMSRMLVVCGRQGRELQYVTICLRSDVSANACKILCYRAKFAGMTALGIHEWDIMD